MRILQVGNVQSVHIQRWAEALSAQGHEVHVATFVPGGIPNVQTHVLRTWGLGKLGYLLTVRSLRRLAKQLAPDVIHAQHVTSYGFVCAMAGLHPLVVTAWGTDVLLTPRESLIGRILVRYALKKADAVTTVAEHMNRHVAELGVMRRDIESIPFGVDAELFRKRTTVNLRGKSIRLISTRNFAPVYDVGTVIRAVNILVQEGHSLLLCLAGDGQGRPMLEALVRQLGLEKIVQFVGRVEHKELPDFLSRSDIFISSALSDGNNISLNEAMASGTFPVATDIPANTQWIENGVNGFVYPGGDVGALANRIREAIGNPALREQAAVRNRAIIEQRADWRVCVQRMNDIYARVAAVRSDRT